VEILKEESTDDNLTEVKIEIKKDKKNEREKRDKKVSEGKVQLEERE
jgi:hypothetical protein